MVETFPAQFLNDLIEQTIEHRRDPALRQEEFEREQAQRWLSENKNQTLVFKSAIGDEKTVNIKDFMWSDDDDEE